MDDDRGKRRLKKVRKQGKNKANLAPKKKAKSIAAPAPKRALKPTVAAPAPKFRNSAATPAPEEPEWNWGNRPTITPTERCTRKLASLLATASTLSIGC